MTVVDGYKFCRSLGLGRAFSLRAVVLALWGVQTTLMRHPNGDIVTLSGNK